MECATRSETAAPSWWGLYFGATEVLDRHRDLIRSLGSYFRTSAGQKHLRSIRVQDDGTRSVLLDYEDLKAASGLTELDEALQYAPVEGLACLSAAAHQSLLQGTHHPMKQGRVKLRLTNHLASGIHIRSLKPASIGKLVSMKGTVVRAGQKRSTIAQMDFQCSKCGGGNTLVFEDGKFATPTKCCGDGCRGRSFTPLHSSVQCRDWQRVRLQELVGADQQPPQQQQGQVPKTIEVEVMDDLVGSCSVGDVVTIVGLIKVIAANQEPGAGKGQSKVKGQCLYLMYLEAISVVHQSKTSPAAGQQGDKEGSEDGKSSNLVATEVKFSMKELEFVLSFHETCAGQQLTFLVQSLCPAIFGQELVKAGMVLAMCGGVRKNMRDANRVPVRGDIHVLIVGDPGLGKSQMLQAAAAAAPRGMYICGNTATSAGLTVSVVKDAVSGDFVFDAGAVVLADRGVCCVDEFDKMPNEHQALLEAMEQQEVSVAKAGLVARLPARTTILAAANPVEGHYNRGKTVAENLKLSAAMLSRFDLTFILLDKPDEALDQCLSEHVLALHSGATERASSASRRLQDRRPGTAGSMHSMASQSQRAAPPGSLLQRLQTPLSDVEPLPHALFRKYIAYARQYVMPKLSTEAAAVLRQFYLQMREQSSSKDSTPVTARQLESLIRLAEARARVDLRELVTRQDALDVVEIMKEAMFDRVVGNDIGFQDFRKQPGSRGGKKAEAARFLGALKRKADRAACDVFRTAELHSLAAEIRLNVKDVDSFLQQLNDEGELLKSNPGEYRIRGGTRLSQGPLASQLTQTPQTSQHMTQMTQGTQRTQATTPSQHMTQMTQATQRTQATQPSQQPFGLRPFGQPRY